VVMLAVNVTEMSLLSTSASF